MLRLELVENPLLHTSHICGFSPVCVLMCLFSKLGRSNVLPHIAQGSRVFSLGRRPGPNSDIILKTVDTEFLEY